MKKLTLILSLLIIMTNGNSQSQRNSDSLYRKMHQEVSIVNTSSFESDIVWERVAIPEGKVLQTLKVMPDNNLYIGCKNGGVFMYENGNWIPLGLQNFAIYDFEEYVDNQLLVGTDEIYLWNNVEWVLISSMAFPFITNTFDYFFGSGSFGDLYRSIDGCFTWEKVHDFSFSEAINGIVATSSDSIFLGVTKYTGNGGGVYLSVDSGQTWNNFGLYEHFIASMGVDNNNQVYAGNGGHFETGQGGLYKYNYSESLWDTIIYSPYVNSVVFNSENHIYIGYDYGGSSYNGGVMHSEDEGQTWILDTTGLVTRSVKDLQFDNAGFLYAMVGSPPEKPFRIYKTSIPVVTEEVLYPEDKDEDIPLIFPNPASTYIIIQAEYFELNIYNQIDQKVMYIPDYRNRIDVTALERGMYIVELVMDGGSSRKKLIIK